MVLVMATAIRYQHGMAKKKLKYNCLKCPAYCCTYPDIIVKNSDLKRLAKYFGVSEKKAAKKYTKKSTNDGSRILRHKYDEYYGTACQFLDSEERQCTIYAGRPKICREYPGDGRCGYYDFLTFERDAQEDPDYVAVTNND